MSNSGRSKSRLVADKRYSAPQKGSGSGGGSRKSPRKSSRKPARRKSTRRNPLVALVLGLFGWAFRLVWGIGWRVMAIVLICLGLAVAYTYATLPGLAELQDARARGSVTLLDRSGDVFAWRGDQFGGVVSAETVSENLKNAVIATEDKRFYWHPGVDPIGVLSAIRINLSEGRGPLSGHGGSTITQQTAKLLCLGVAYDKTQWESEKAYIADCRQTSLWRKIKEAVYALAMEAKYTKDEILSVYLNRCLLYTSPSPRD